MTQNRKTLALHKQASNSLRLAPINTATLETTEITAFTFQYEIIFT